jgi:sugar phosphate isomerase/epimerase
MRSAVTVSLVPEARGGPFVFWDGVADACVRASAHGFDALEIFPPSAAALDVPAARDLLARHGLRAAAVGTGGGWVTRQLTLTHSDPVVRRDAIAFVRDLIDAAGQLGAPAIVGSMQGRWEGGVSAGQARAWLGESLVELAHHAARHHQPLLLEPLNRYEGNLCRRLGETAAWLRTLPANNLRLLADLFHLNIEEPDIAEALREAGPLLGHVHFADSNRQAVGFGHTAMAPIAAALREIGYAGYLSAEILPLPDADTAARQTLQAFRHWTQAR